MLRDIHLYEVVKHMTAIVRITDLLWFPWLLIFFLVVGGYFSLRTGFFQFFRFRLWWKYSFGSLLRSTHDASTSGITPFQALSTALAATIGTGSIAGVATAIFYGGPGAVFWMWLSAILGMMTSCAEKSLAVQHRQQTTSGNWHGGPMYYIEKAFSCKAPGRIFAVFCIAETLIGGNLVQANSIATALQATFDWHPAATGIAVALLTACVVVGGIQRIGRFSERLVPCMAIFFVVGGCIVLCCRASALPGVLHCIIQHAFTPKAAVGGYGAAAAMRFGIARGVFTNEAGLGTSTIAHAAANAKTPVHQGIWGIFEVFISTLVICTITALAILSTGVYEPTDALRAISSGSIEPSMLGAPLSIAAFSTIFGKFGGVFVSLCLILFAFTSILGASYYGEQCLAYLTSSRRYIPIYRLFFLCAVIIGSVGDLSSIWVLVDLSNGLMAIPNLAALLRLSGDTIRQINQFQSQQH